TVGGFVVVVAVLVAITLTPAMLSLLGHRALSKRERRRLTDEVPNSQPKKQLKRMSNTRAVLSTIGAVAVRSITAIPLCSPRPGIPAGSAEAPDTAEPQAHAAQAEPLRAGTNAPLVSVADIPADLSEEDLQKTPVKQAEQISSLDNV